MKSSNEFTTNEEYNEYLRIYFAGLAMQGYIANFSENRKTQNGFIPVGEYEIIAQHSVQIADELLKQLENK